MVSPKLSGLADKVGKWSFLYDEAMRTFWETQLRAQAQSDEELQQELADIEDEARRASVEISEAGTLSSMIGDDVVYSAELHEGDGSLYFDKPNGARVVVTLDSSGALVADEPGKPVMRFCRITR